MSATPIILPAPMQSNVNEAPEKKPEAPAAETSDAGNARDALTRSPLFAGLSDKVIDALAECAEVRAYAENQTVFSMGQYDGGEFFIVSSGVMRVSLMSPETGAIVFEDLQPGGVFGLDLVFNTEGESLFQSLTMTALGDLELIGVDSEEFRNLAGQRPSLMKNVAAHFARELTARRFASPTAEAAPEQRVYAELQKFVEQDGSSGQWRVPQMPKHRELADMADVEEHVAAAAIAAIIQDGVVRRDYPGLIVNDIARFNKLSQ